MTLYVTLSIEEHQKQDEWLSKYTYVSLFPTVPTIF